MSDLDRENLRQEERQKLVNHSDNQDSLQVNLAKRKKRIKVGVGIAVLLIIVILAIVLPLTLKKHGDNPGPDPGPPGPNPPGPPIDPFNYPEYNPYTVDQSTWVSSVFKGEFIVRTKQQVQPQYKSFMGLGDQQNPTNMDYKPVNPKDIPIGQVNNVGTDQIKFNIDMVDNFDVRILIQDNNNQDAHRVQDPVFPRPVLSWEARLSQVDFKVSNDTFGISFGNIYTKNEIISTKNRKLFVSDKFSEIGFVLPTQRCYGLGQRNGQFQLQHGAYTLSTRFREEGLPTDDGLGGKGGNHIHPFIMCQTVDKDFFGMFFAGNAPQHFEVITYPGDSRLILNYITLGGPIEIYTIMRGKPEDIISKFHGIIGNSQMPPYFSLGFFQGSNTYNTLKKVQDVVDGYGSIPVALEGVFMTNYNAQPHETFSVNSDTFKGLNDYLAKLKGNNQRVIFGASLAIVGNTDVFKLAIKHKCLVDSIMYRGQQVIGVLDQTQVFYIDPFHDGTVGFFEDALPQFYNLLGAANGGYDGILLQDSYLPNQIQGEIVQKAQAFGRKLQDGQLTEETVGTYAPYQINQDQSQYSSYNLPFVPTPWSLDNFSMPMNGSEGGNDVTPKDFNLFLHNANSHRIFQKVNEAWKSADKALPSPRRPFLLSDASWSGSGAYGVAVVTDLYRSWDTLKHVVSQAMGLSLSGMSNTMVDGCGTLGPLDEELCARWMQLSAFMPMFRNFYNETYRDPVTGERKTTDPSEFWLFKNQDYQAAYTAAIAQRLPFTRYLYSQLYYAYRVGAALVKPLFYDYPMDDQAFWNPEHTYMLGDSIKVSPVLDQGKQEGDAYQSYFPQGLWHDLNDYKTVIDTSKGGQWMNLKASNTQTNIHLKGGKIIPYQPNTLSLKTTRDFETKLRMSFIVARDAALSYADGYVLVDDGISQDSYDLGPASNPSKQKFTYWKLRYAEKSINFWVEYGDYTYEPPEGYQIHMLQDIVILNAADLSSTDFACFLGTNLSPVELKPDYNEYTNTLTLKPTTKNPDIKFNQIGFIKFGDSSKEPNFCDASSFQYVVTGKTLAPDDHTWTFDLQSKQGTDVLEPLVAVFQQLDDAGTINLEITTKADYDSGKKIIYRVPDIVYDDKTHFPRDKLTKKLSQFIKYSETPFSYSIYKDSSDETTLLWRSDPNRLYFSKYFLMDSGIFNMNQNVDQPLLGMGERAGSIFYKNEQGGIHSRYTFDQANPIDDGLPPGRNMYGYQPLYAFQSNIKTTFDWFGVFDVSSYATDYILYSDNGSGKKETQIHKITIGGTINKFFFVGSKPDDIIKTYSKLVGFPSVPPIWAFGWQQCRFGWVTDDAWWNVYQQYKATDLPLDTMWADIDYMDDYKLFTISQQSYPTLPDKVDQIKKDGLTFVPIMDAGVAVRMNQGYKALDDGIKNDVFIKQANKQDYLTAGVWCGNAYFPDFFNPATVTWWQTNFQELYDVQKLHFDGVWLDENEATNFCNGYCKPEERPGDSLRNKPFYVPGWRDLEDKALGVDGYHPTIDRHEYDVHNLFPLMQAKATADFLISQGKRPYVLTRSNFPGIGKYAHHWMGDNWSTVDYMKLSVDGIYSYNLFALPFMGSDICGFNGDAAPDLCTRWHILGSLYPFARNHNQNASRSQEPFYFNQTVPGKDYKYYDVIRTALVNRYSFIKYYYSSFYTLYLEGGSFFKPLFYEYPLDAKAYLDIEINILLGDALKVAMETTTLEFPATRDYYFPKDRWCRILPAVADPATDCYDSPGDTNGYVTLTQNLEDYYIFIRNGYIIPWQDAQTLKVRKTLDLTKSPTDLMILPVQDNVDMTITTTKQAVARGYVIFDDGVSTLDKDYARFEFYLIKNADGKTFKMTFANTGKLQKGQTPLEHEKLGNIYILWASKSGTQALTKAVITVTGGATTTVNVSIDPKTETLTIPITTKDVSYYLWDITQIDLS